MLEITPFEAVLLRILSEAGAHQMQSGSITIHFDGQGVPVRFEKRETKQLSPAGALAIKVVL